MTNDSSKSGPYQETIYELKRNRKFEEENTEIITHRGPKYFGIKYKFMCEP